jgi:quinol monooxygenase YgiN
MQTLTAIIRAKPGHEARVRAALIKVGEFVRANEPYTIDFFVAHNPDDPCVFTTYERFTDKAAMDRHNNGAGSKGFFAEAGNSIDGSVTVVTALEIFER